MLIVEFELVNDVDRGGLKSWLMLVEMGVGDSMRRNFGTRADVDPFQLTLHAKNSA